MAGVPFQRSQFIQVHDSKFKLNLVCHLGQAPELRIAHAGYVHPSPFFHTHRKKAQLIAGLFRQSENAV